MFIDLYTAVEEQHCSQFMIFFKNWQFCTKNLISGREFQNSKDKNLLFWNC